MACAPSRVGSSARVAKANWLVNSREWGGRGRARSEAAADVTNEKVKVPKKPTKEGRQGVRCARPRRGKEMRVGSRVGRAADENGG